MSTADLSGGAGGGPGGPGGTALQQAAPYGPEYHPELAGHPGTPVNSWLRFLGSELRLIFGRRRNQALLGVLAALPILIGVALRLQASSGGGGAGGGGGGPGPRFLLAVPRQRLLPRAARDPRAPHPGAPAGRRGGGRGLDPR